MIGEAFAKGIGMALVVTIFGIVAFLFKWINRKINGAEINRSDEKYKFLEQKFKNLEGTNDKKTGREIKEIWIETPINPKKNWKVYKTLKGKLLSSDEDIVICNMSDKSLELNLDKLTNV